MRNHFRVPKPPLLISGCPDFKTTQKRNPIAVCFYNLDGDYRMVGHMLIQMVKCLPRAFPALECWLQGPSGEHLNPDFYLAPESLPTMPGLPSLGIFSLIRKQWSFIEFLDFFGL